MSKKYCVVCRRGILCKYCKEYEVEGMFQLLCKRCEKLRSNKPKVHLRCYDCNTGLGIRTGLMEFNKIYCSNCAFVHL